MKKLLLLLFLSSIGAWAQSTADLKIYLDCQSYRYDCYSDYLRTEISYVEFVRDRKIAQVQIIPTYVATASNGVDVKLVIIGLKEFSHRADTLNFVRTVNDTDKEYRENLLKTIKAGLIPYLAKLNQLDKVLISSVKTTKDSAAVLRKESSTKDPWNYWLFRVGGGGFFTGDNNYNSSLFGSSFTVSRTTEKIKTEIGFNYDSNVDTYKIIDNGKEEVITNKQKNYNFSSNLVGAISKKWSWGTFLSAQSSIFRNYRFSINPAVGIEYNVFPYTRYNDKYVLFRYTLGAVANNYYKTTIFDKEKELLGNQTIGAYSTIVKKWGNISSSAIYSNYLHDFSKNSLNLYASMAIRITKGLNFTFGGTFSSIHNLINLQKGDATAEDILIKRRQLNTSFDYMIGAGLVYTFGSIFNNTVNPRFNTMYNNISISW